MSMKPRSDGGPAFPLSGGNWDMAGGMSLRDYFAAQLVIGIVASESNPVLAHARLQAARKSGRGYEAQLAVEAYQLADAMLAARSQDGSL